MIEKFILGFLCGGVIGFSVGYFLPRNGSESDSDFIGGGSSSAGGLTGTQFIDPDTQEEKFKRAKTVDDMVK